VRRVCLQLAGAGWDARAVEGVSWELKKRLGKWAYVISGLRALRSARAPVRVASGSEVARGDFVMIGNGRYYGGPFPFMHRAELADGLMDVTVFEKFNWSALPGCGAKFLFGSYFRPGRQKYLQGAEIELTSEGPAPLQLDGDFVGHLPATIRVLPRAMRVVVP
jgi:diacylglycerol kinase (ATP)